MQRKLQKKVCVRLSNDRMMLLEDVATRQGFTVSAVVRSLVYRYLEDVKKLNVNKELRK